MEAFVKFGKNPREARLQEVSQPEPGPEQVLIEISGCGICGSDLHAYHASPGFEWVKTPVVLGHEFAGTVSAVGSAVQDIAAGDRVVVIAIQGCGRCGFCRSGDTHLCYARQVIGLSYDGGMASHAVVHPRYLVRLPADFDMTAAPMIEPLSVAVHTLARTPVYPGQRVVVTGPGPIGLLCATLARLSGATVLICGTDKDEISRLPAASHFGLTAANVEKSSIEDAVKLHFGNNLPDIWIEASGSTQALKASVNLVRRGGTILGVGLFDREFSWFPTPSVRAELSMLFSYASCYADYARAIDLISTRAVDIKRLGQQFSLRQARKAFEEAEAGRTIKPVLIP
jgi:L-iditol 2-dehydrogenase